MVAISLYRGNLHRVPDVPRRWLMPNHQISLKDFKTLLDRRSKALSRHRSSSTTIATTSSNPNPNPNPNSDSHLKQQEENAKDNVETQINQQFPELDPPKVSNPLEGTPKKEFSSEEVKDQKKLDGGDGSVTPVDGPDTTHHSKIDPAAPENPNTETCLTSDKADAPNGKEKRKREVEEKLQILNSKKHNLVQVLKQIINAEEELNRRNSMKGVAVRPSLPLHVDVANDFGSMARQVTPRMGSEGNIGGDTEAGEADDASKENTQSRHLLRMSSTSPSSDSPHRRPPYVQHIVVPRPSRANLAVSGSPSRFAPTGHSHPPNLPTVSVSGTNYIASSPSPAASGGTSAFRDARLPSPWN